MLRRAAIQRAFEEAGSVNALVGLWAFVDPYTFVTKGGDLGVVYRLHSEDYEGLDHAQRRHVVHQYEAALRLLDAQTRVYQYLVKRRAAPITTGRCRAAAADELVQARTAFLNSDAGELFQIDTYLVLLHEGLAGRAGMSGRVQRAWRHPGAALRAWL